MNNFKEWFVKSVLVRAEHRDSAIKELNALKKMMDTCGMCNGKFVVNTPSTCQHCGISVCNDCAYKFDNYRFCDEGCASLVYAYLR
jgi:hypothetical protein